MKHFILAVTLLLGLYTAVSAQTLTINAHTAEVSSSQKNNLYPLNTLYFVYNSADGTFDARQVDNRNSVFKADVTSVTISGASTTALKLAFISNSHAKAISGTYTTLFPKNEVNILYKSSDKKVEVRNRNNGKETPIWTGHVDSIKTGTTDSTTALRLTAMRKFNAFRQVIAGGITPTVAAGAAAGSSPTVTVAGTAVAGAISLTTGTTAVSTGVLCTVTLPSAFPNGCYVQLTPANATTAVQIARVFVSSTASTIVLNASGTALSDATAYVWHYQITGY